MNLYDKLIGTNIFIDNEYFYKYIELIEMHLNNAAIKDVTQKHHIIPKYYYTHNNLKIDNSKENLVNLPFYYHILAHYYLAMCSKNMKDKYSNEAALARMSITNIKNLNIPELNLDILQNLYTEYQDYNRQCHIGTTHTTTQSTKNKISDANKGKYVGYVHIYFDDVTEKIVPKENLEEYLKLGWKIGRCKKTKNNLSKNYNYNSKGMLGKHQSDKQKKAVKEALNNKPKSTDTRKKMSLSKQNKKLVSNKITGESFYISITEIQDYLDKGFYLGRLSK